MQGVVTRKHVVTHPIVILESFGLKVLVRALLADRTETFLDVVTRCAEEDERSDMKELDLVRTTRRFIGFERRARDLYQHLSRQLADLPEAAKFFTTMSRQEEGHAIVLSRVRREIRRGRLWKESKDLHLDTMKRVDALLAGFEAEVRGGVTLDRALDIAERIEGSELDVVFDSLNGSVDMRSRTRFERFFVLSQNHLAYCKERIQSLRAAHG